LKGVEALAARGGALGSEPFGLAVRDFYLTNPIARASAVMAELSALREAAVRGTTGTHG
jgi:NADH-quinone oxidoreductase subunit G